MDGDSYCDVTERLFGEFERVHRLPVIALVVGQCRVDLGGSPRGAVTDAPGGALRHRRRLLPGPGWTAPAPQAGPCAAVDGVGGSAGTPVVSWGRGVGRGVGSGRGSGRGDPAGNFTSRREGDLSASGVCASLIAEKVGAACCWPDCRS